VKMDNPNITMEEYIRLEKKKLTIVFNDTLTSEAALSCEPTVSSLNNDEIDFRISFEESNDEDLHENDNDKVMPLLSSLEPTVSYFDDLDHFKDFENEFPAIVYNEAPTSKSDFLAEPTLCTQHIDEFDLKEETSLSECDEEEQNVSIRHILGYGYGVSISCTVLGPREGKSTNIGGEFTNLEILKCWSLETSRRLFNTQSCSTKRNLENLPSKNQGSFSF
ncbi:hypothetical protein Tco_1193197, partial [Tanacetum coccineum]